MTSFLYAVNLDLKLITKQLYVHYQNYCEQSRMTAVRKLGGQYVIPLVVQGGFLRDNDT